MTPIPAFDPPSSIASKQVDEMVAAWRRGERPLAEDFLARHPDLDDEAAIRLIFEEFCLRQEFDVAVDPAEFGRRFPDLSPELELLLDCQRMMDPASNPAALPEVGDDLAGFRLLAELGRGMHGRVFLASQLALAGRPVVIKVTPLGRDEHLSLARLQHMNIVPLYSEQVLADRPLQVLCMPFLGGATLAQVLDLLKGHDPARRTGSQFLGALDRVQAALPVTLSARGPFRRHLARSTYVEAISWIGVCLADGLQYAHDRNFVHMDIKPSNVLIAGDGQPMLLDFHLAREPIRLGDPPPAQIGGTPGYMAPEQARAMVAVGEGRPITDPLDGRADLYSLGLLLYEVLCGQDPRSDAGPRLPLHKCNPRVSVGLSDIIHKCLRPDPRDRYADAASLAADLRRSLEGQPLRGVPNRSPVERWRNWRRRHPHALSRTLILVVAALMASSAVALLWAAYLQRVREVEAALADGRARLDRRQYPEAIRALKRGLALAEHLPAVALDRRELAEGLARARRDAKADELHQLAELVRFRYGIDPPPPDEARALIRRGVAIWQDRDLLLKPVAGRQEPDVERTIRADLLDFALAWIALLARSKPPTGSAEARSEALRALGEAEALLGPSPAIDRERQALAAPSGQAHPSPGLALTPGSAWEHFALGKSYLRSGETRPALEQFQRGLALRPQDFWLNFYQGLCAYRLERFDEAANAFRVCIALAPEAAECSFNRALALGALGQVDQAIGDYTRALQLNPALASAALNRGILHYQQGHLDDAVADLNRALAHAVGRSDLGIIHYNLSLVDMARGNRPAALENLKLAAGYGHEGARLLRERLQ